MSARRRTAGAGARPAPARSAPDLAVAWVLLAALALLRAILAREHGTAFWSLDTLRFAPGPGGWSGWAGWLVVAALLIPAVARLVLPLCDRLGNAIVRRPWPAALALAACAAALVWALPDRVGWIGDAVIRQGAVADKGGIAESLFPQASRLDLVMHLRLPRALIHAGLDPALAVRVIGALEAAALGALAVAFAGATGLTGAGAALAALGALLGPQLGLFTGYSKSFTEVVLATLLVATAALAMQRGRRWDPLLAAGLALGVFAHRSGLVLVPAALAAWVLAGRAEPVRWREPRVWLACGLGLAAVGLALAEALPVMRAVDIAAHLTPHEPGTGGAWWRGVFAGTRPLDFMNVVFGLPVLLLAALPSLRALAREPGSRVTLVWFGVLVAGWIAGMLLIHPAQGYARDYDDVAAFLTALGLLAAWALGARAGAGVRERAIVAPALATAAFATTLWLAIPAEPAALLARVHAFVTETPARAPDELGTSWEFLGMRAIAEERWSDAAEALGHAVEWAPAPATMREWALAEIQSGRPEHAREIYRTLLARDPRNVMGWYSLAAVSTQVGDYVGAADALRRLLAVAPNDSASIGNLRLIEQTHPETRVPR